MRGNNNNLRRRAGLFCGLLSAALLLGGCIPGVSGPAGIGTIQSGNAQELSGDMKAIEKKLQMIQSVVDKYYLEDEDIDLGKLEEGIYRGYLNELGDKYSFYYTADEYALIQESMQGTYCGIGALLQQSVDTGIISIVKPFKGSPCEEAGILKDDVINKVNGEDTAGRELTEVVSHIKGEEGTTVNLEIYRPSEDRYFTVDVERRLIETPMAEYEMLDDNIGYIALQEFMETTPKQFNEAVDELSAQGMEGLVIDLRDNPGGLVDAAVEILDRILPEDQLLVYTVDKNNTREEYHSKDSETIDLPIVVLMNDSSASASEIVSGCLQDLDKATLVGEKSFGKGIVQYVIELDDGSAMQVTAAKYYTPEGRNIHGTGLDPDVEVELDDEKEGDEQLDKAIEILQEEMQGQKAAFAG